MLFRVLAGLLASAVTARPTARNEAAVLTAQAISSSATDSGERIPPIFNLSPEKSGTSTFADFTWRSLNLTTFHNHVRFEALLGPPDKEACVDASPDEDYPDYAGWAEGLNKTSGALAAVLTSDIGAWADSPVNVLYPLTETLIPDAKYVVWPRPSDEWIASFEEFFCKQHSPHPSTAVSRVFKLHFSVCSPCDGADKMERVKSAYEAHLANVQSYFSATAERSARLFTLDFKDEAVGRKLCEFAYDLPPGAARCAHLGAMPLVQEDNLDKTMFKEADEAFVGAMPGGVWPKGWPSPGL